MTCRELSLQGIVYLLLLLDGEDLVGQTGNSLGYGSVHNPQSSAGFRDLPGQCCGTRVCCCERTGRMPDAQGLLPSFDPRKRSSSF